MSKDILQEILEPTPSPPPDEDTDEEIILRTPHTSVNWGLDRIQQVSLKASLLNRFIEDNDIREVVVIGRTNEGKFILENTEIHDLYGLLGFVQVRLLGMIKS